MSLFDEEEDDFEIEMDKEKFDQIIVRAEEEKRKKQRTTTTNAFDFMKNSNSLDGLNLSGAYIFPFLLK